MQGLLATALASAAPPHSLSSSARPAPAPAPLSSANLALHTSTNPPAPRRTVQQFLASVTRVHAANAYDLGPPPAGELDHVKTPPRAVEARRKRKLQDLEDRGESWITRDETTPRAAATTGTEQALVLIRPDADLLLRGGSTTTDTADLKQQHERKKSLVASMMRRKSTPPANTASATQRNPLLPIGGLSPASNESSILIPRTETKLATRRREEDVEERGGKENRPGRKEKSSLRKGKSGNRRDTDKDAEQEELEEHQARTCSLLYHITLEDPLLDARPLHRSRSAPRPSSPERSDPQGPLARRDCGRRNRRCQAQEVQIEAAYRYNRVRFERVV